MKCENMGLGIVRSSSFGRSKRVTLSKKVDLDFISTTPTKRFCSANSFSIAEDLSVLETLPKDILIKIMCGVDHDDLKSLFHVSRAIREVTLIAKRCHFEFSTPRKTIGFRNAVDVEESLDDIDEVEAPNAPRQTRISWSRLDRKKLAVISVALFASDSE